MTVWRTQWGSGEIEPFDIVAEDLRRKGEIAGERWSREIIGATWIVTHTAPADIDVAEMQRAWDALSSPYAVLERVDAVPVGDAWRD